MTCPPNIPGEGHRRYDSCVDKTSNPSIFVVFDRNQCYPEYLIAYQSKSTKKTAAAVQNRYQAVTNVDQSVLGRTTRHTGTCNVHMQLFNAQSKPTTNYRRCIKVPSTFVIKHIHYISRLKKSVLKLFPKLNIFIIEYKCSIYCRRKLFIYDFFIYCRDEHCKYRYTRRTSELCNQHVSSCQYNTSKYFISFKSSGVSNL